MTMLTYSTPTDAEPRSHRNTEAQAALTEAPSAAALPSNTVVLAGGPRFGAVPSPAGGRPRAQTSPTAVARLGRMLLRRVDPTDPMSPPLVRRAVQRFYAEGILKPPGEPPLDSALGQAYANRGRLFLQGKVLGVGASTLALDYARATDARAKEARSPYRAAHLDLISRVNSESKFLDALSLAVRAPLSNVELRNRSPEYLAKRLRAACQRRGYSMITIDHVSKTGPKVRPIIAGIIRYLDPEYCLDTDDPFAANDPVGVILVDHVPPEVLFRKEPEVLEMLEEKVVVLHPYTTVEQVAEALRQAGIGLDDLDLSDPEDATVASLVLERTSGLPALMEPLFALVDELGARNGCRPGPRTVEMALPYVRRLIELHAGRTRATRGDADAGLPAANRGDGSDRPDPAQPGVGTRPARKSGTTRSKEKVLRERSEAQGVARLEQRDVLRKAHVTLPGA